MLATKLSACLPEGPSLLLPAGQQVAVSAAPPYQATSPDQDQHPENQVQHEIHDGMNMLQEATALQLPCPLHMPPAAATFCSSWPLDLSLAVSSPPPMHSPPMNTCTGITKGKVMDLASVELRQLIIGASMSKTPLGHWQCLQQQELVQGALMST